LWKRWQNPNEFPYVRPVLPVTRTRILQISIPQLCLPSLCVIFWVPDGTQKVVSSVHWLGFYPGEDFTLVISFRSICTMRWWLLSSMWGRHPFSWEWILFLYPYDKPFVLVVRDQASIPRVNRVFSSKIMRTNFVLNLAIEISRRNTFFFPLSFKTDSSSTNSGS